MGSSLRSTEDRQGFRNLNFNLFKVKSGFNVVNPLRGKDLSWRSEVGQLSLSVGTEL